jgi:hypothetical protein
VIRPNELTNPGERAAYARVEALFEALDGFAVPDVLLIPASGLGPEAREARLAETERLADRLGRRELYDNALEHARDSLLTRAVAEFRGRIGGIGFSPAYDPSSQAAAIAAISDAVAVAVVEDQLSLADIEALAGPARQVLGLEAAAPNPAAGPGTARPATHRHPSHAARRAAWAQDAGAPREPLSREATIAGAPSDRDWAEADHGATSVDPGEPGSGRSPTTRLVLGTVGIGLAAGVLVAGVAGGTAALALAGAVALVAVIGSLTLRERSDEDDD